MTVAAAAPEIAIGAGQEAFAKKLCSFCMWMCVVSGIILTGAVLLFMEEILTLIGASGDTWEYARHISPYSAIMLFIIICETLISTGASAPGIPIASTLRQTPSFAVKSLRILLNTGMLLGVFYVLGNALQAMGAALPSLVINLSRQGLAYWKPIPTPCLP